MLTKIVCLMFACALLSVAFLYNHPVLSPTTTRVQPIKLPRQRHVPVATTITEYLQKNNTLECIAPCTSSNPQASKSGVSAVLTHFKRTQNVKDIIQQLKRYSFIGEIIVWNNAKGRLDGVFDTDIRVINSETNVGDLGKYKACAEAAYNVCFYQDDDWDTSAYIEEMWHEYSKDCILTATEAFTWATHKYWTYYTASTHLRSEFSWIGCGSFFTPLMAQQHINTLERHFSSAEQQLADVAFTWLANVPVQALEVELLPRNQDGAFSAQPNFQLRQQRMMEKVGSLVFDVNPNIQTLKLYTDNQCTTVSVAKGLALCVSFSVIRDIPVPNSEYPFTRKNLYDHTAMHKHFVAFPFDSVFKTDSSLWSSTLAFGDKWGVRIATEISAPQQILVMGEGCDSEKWKVIVDDNIQAKLITPWIWNTAFFIMSSVEFQFVGEGKCHIKVSQIKRQESNALNKYGGFSFDSRNTNMVDWWNSEQSTVLTFQQELKPDMTYIGIGEWAGPTAVLASSIAANIFVFDPDKYVTSHLFRNVLHNLQANKTAVVDTRCVSNANGQTKMSGSGGSGSAIAEAGHIYKKWKDSSLPHFRVMCITFDILLKEYALRNKTPLFIKIDTEGAESLIVPSLFTFVEQWKANIVMFISMHDASNTQQKEKISQFLNKCTNVAISSSCGHWDGCNLKSPSGVPVYKGGNKLAFGSNIVFNYTTICDSCDYVCKIDSKT